MKSFFRAHRFIDNLAGFPPLRSVLETRYEKIFASNTKANLFRGVFETFDEAQASAPLSRPVGYDNDDAAAMYLARTKTIFSTDYPIMFWLEKFIGEGCQRIVDVGGHIGVSYYAYRRHMRYPEGLHWKVLDVPAVVKRGRELSEKMDVARQLEFTESFEDCRDAEVIMALGSLQYLPETLAQTLERLGVRPKHLLLSLVPIHLQRSYFTLQSIGTAFCPYRIFAMDEFIQSFERLGYTLLDRWENVEKSCPIPFREGHSLDRYYGFQFSGI